MVAHCWVRYCPNRLNSVWSIPVAWIGPIRLGIVDQQLSVGQIVSLTACPSQPNVDDGSQTPLPPEHLRPPPSNEGRSGRGETSAAPM